MVALAWDGVVVVAGLAYALTCCHLMSTVVGGDYIAIGGGGVAVASGAAFASD